ncbi:MAG: hypothetical protein KAR64_02840 [Thermoplasmatales archaeon]|nr:hypothetical protein [Thermoplasmatales archaeon]
MKTNLSTQDNPTLAKTGLKPDIIVKSGITELDRLQGGFKAGEITFLDGNSKLISEMPNQLCVNTYRTFHSDTIYIDGGMCANPYKIARYARMMEIDQRETLEHVQISRAFTVFQLSTLLQDKLEPLIEKHRPRTLIIGMFPCLFFDPDISTRESQTLLKNVLKKIKELTQKYGLITVFTNLDSTQMSNYRNLRDMLYPAVDEIIRMKQLEQCTCIDLVKKQEKVVIVDFAKGQLRLEEFGMVM